MMWKETTKEDLAGFHSLGPAEAGTLNTVKEARKCY